MNEVPIGISDFSDLTENKSHSARMSTTLLLLIKNLKKVILFGTRGLQREALKLFGC